MKNLLLAAFLFTFAIAANAQSKPARKLQSYLAGLKGGDITVAEFIHIIDSPVVVKDEKGVTYPISRFTVGYKFSSTYEDEDSGEKKTTSDFRSQEYTDENRMSELWRQSVKDNVRTGDELLLFNVLVRLKNGKKMMVPQISFKIK